MKRTTSQTIEKIYYPHLKITGERFPRLLVTRVIHNDAAEYFGAFLPNTAVRIWLYHLNRIFRLRSCQIEIDGNFLQPCQMYFMKKCVAPCVNEICSEDEYAENVQALRLFLSGNEKEYEKFIVAKIDEYSENLEFESAARWRDVWRESMDLARDKKIEIRLDDAVDTYTFEEKEDALILFLVTTRGRKFLGDKEFVFDKNDGMTAQNALESVLRDFYRFHIPREIRLPFDFSDRKSFEAELSRRFGRKVKISVTKNELNKTAQFRFKRTKLESDLDKISETFTPNQISTKLQKIFKLPKKPKNIECFDVAHISNQDFITASAIWENGEIRREKSEYWITDSDNEPQAMAYGVSKRLKRQPAPNLILIDGGRGQLNAAINILEENGINNIPIISAVKPPGKHQDVSHFLTSDGERIEFIPGDKIFELLRNLRDEAHRTANELHRQYRDNKHIFALKTDKAGQPINLPLAIIRFDEIDGAAEDLRPIKVG